MFVWGEEKMVRKDNSKSPTVTFLTAASDYLKRRQMLRKIKYLSDRTTKKY